MVRGLAPQSCPLSSFWPPCSTSLKHFRRRLTRPRSKLQPLAAPEVGLHHLSSTAEPRLAGTVSCQLRSYKTRQSLQGLAGGCCALLVLTPNTEHRTVSHCQERTVPDPADTSCVDRRPRIQNCPGGCLEGQDKSHERSQAWPDSQSTPRNNSPPSGPGRCPEATLKAPAISKLLL